MNQLFYTPIDIKGRILDAVFHWKNITWDERKNILELAERNNLISIVPKKLREQTAKMFPFDKEVTGGHQNH